MSSIASRLVYVAVAIAAYFAYIGFELEESHTSGGLEKRAAITQPPTGGLATAQAGVVPAQILNVEFFVEIQTGTFFFAEMFYPQDTRSPEDRAFVNPVDYTGTWSIVMGCVVPEGEFEPKDDSICWNASGQLSELYDATLLSVVIPRFSDKFVDGGRYYIHYQSKCEYYPADYAACVPNPATCDPCNFAYDNFKVRSPVFTARYAQAPAPIPGSVSSAYPIRLQGGNQPVTYSLNVVYPRDFRDFRTPEQKLLPVNLRKSYYRVRGCLVLEGTTLAETGGVSCWTASAPVTEFRDAATLTVTIPPFSSSVVADRRYFVHFIAECSFDAALYTTCIPQTGICRACAGNFNRGFVITPSFEMISEPILPNPLQESVLEGVIKPANQIPTILTGGSRFDVTIFYPSDPRLAEEKLVVEPIAVSQTYFAVKACVVPALDPIPGLRENHCWNAGEPVANRFDASKLRVDLPRSSDLFVAGSRYYLHFHVYCTYDPSTYVGCVPGQPCAPCVNGQSLVTRSSEFVAAYPPLTRVVGQVASLPFPGRIQAGSRLQVTVSYPVDPNDSRTAAEKAMTPAYGRSYFRTKGCLVAEGTTLAAGNAGCWTASNPVIGLRDATTLTVLMPVASSRVIVGRRYFIQFVTACEFDSTVTSRLCLAANGCVPCAGSLDAADVVTPLFEVIAPAVVPGEGILTRALAATILTGSRFDVTAFYPSDPRSPAEKVVRPVDLTKVYTLMRGCIIPETALQPIARSFCWDAAGPVNNIFDAITLRVETPKFADNFVAGGRYVVYFYAICTYNAASYVGTCVPSATCDPCKNIDPNMKIRSSTFVAAYNTAPARVRGSVLTPRPFPVRAVAGTTIPVTISYPVDTADLRTPAQKALPVDQSKSYYRTQACLVAEGTTLASSVACWFAAPPVNGLRDATTLSVDLPSLSATVLAGRRYYVHFVSSCTIDVTVYSFCIPESTTCTACAGNRFATDVITSSFELSAVSIVRGLGSIIAPSPWPTRFVAGTTRALTARYTADTRTAAQKAASPPADLTRTHYVARGCLIPTDPSTAAGNIPCWTASNRVSNIYDATALSAVFPPISTNVVADRSYYLLFSVACTIDPVQYVGCTPGSVGCDPCAGDTNGVDVISFTFTLTRV